MTRTLGNIELCRTPAGEPIWAVGNSAALFKVKVGGKVRKLRCYLRKKSNQKIIYREHLLPKELFVYADDKVGEWCDVVVEEWTDGITLYGAMMRSLSNPAQMAKLSEQFDRMAFDLLGKEWAHGDLKPDNIIVDGEGTMHLIDFDAVYYPGVEEPDDDERGTPEFQHPMRRYIYAKEIDDYPIALMSVVLKALSRDGLLYKRFGTEHMMMISPEKAVAGTDEALAAIERCLAEHGDALHYRMAQLLRMPTPRLFGLSELLRYSAMPPRRRDEPLRLAEREGAWGYCDSQGFVVAPVYDCGFEFSDSLAAVSVGGCWHFIDECGRVAINCSDCDSVKPFCDGVAVKISKDRRVKIDRNGREIL